MRFDFDYSRLYGYVPPDLISKIRTADEIFKILLIFLLILALTFVTLGIILLASHQKIPPYLFWFCIATVLFATISLEVVSRWRMRITREIVAILENDCFSATKKAPYADQGARDEWGL